jgi:hypothetical protein
MSTLMSSCDQGCDFRLGTGGGTSYRARVKSLVWVGPAPYAWAPSFPNTGTKQVNVFADHNAIWNRVRSIDFMKFFHFLSFYLTASTRDKKESISAKQPYRPWHKMKLPPIAVLMSYPTPNYINPHTRGSSLIIVNAVFLGIATIVVLLRLYTRLFVRRWFGLDDVFICCAFVSNYLILYSAHLFSIVSRLQLRSWRETITYLVLIAITDLQCRSQRCCGHWLNRLWLESTHLGHTVGLAVR